MVDIQNRADGSVNKNAHHGGSHATVGGEGLFQSGSPGFTSTFALIAFTFCLHLVHNEAVTLLRY